MARAVRGADLPEHPAVQLRHGQDPTRGARKGRSPHREAQEATVGPQKSNLLQEWDDRKSVVALETQGVRDKILGKTLWRTDSATLKTTDSE